MREVLIMRTMAYLPAAGLAALIALAADPASAQNASPQLLTLSCAGCHGTNGRSPGAIPALNGRPAMLIAQMLRDFRSDTRPATVMNRIAKGYTDEEIDAVAREIASAWR